MICLQACRCRICVCVDLHTATFLITLQQACWDCNTVMCPTGESKASPVCISDCSLNTMCLLFLHFLDCYKLRKDGNAWMLLNPNESEQNAQRILDTWSLLLASDSFRQARRERNHPRLLALLCSFNKAGQLAADAPRRSKKVTVWRLMAAMPPNVLCRIAEKAELVDELVASETD